MENVIINLDKYRDRKKDNKMDLKNVKIDEEIHREMSIKSAMGRIGKTTLTNALIRAGLSLPDEILLKFIKEELARENGNSFEL
jgi:hypothetical protein